FHSRSCRKSCVPISGGIPLPPACSSRNISSTSWRRSVSGSSPWWQLTTRASRGLPIAESPQAGAGSVAIMARSILFNVLFYISFVLYMLVALPFFLLPYWMIVDFAKVWSHTNLWLLKTVCGLHVEFTGLGKIPPGPLLIACKHQSMLETFALVPLFSRP